MVLAYRRKVTADDVPEGREDQGAEPGRGTLDDSTVEERARRLHRADAGIGGVALWGLAIFSRKNRSEFFGSWESLPEATKEQYRAYARGARNGRSA